MEESLSMEELNEIVIGVYEAEERRNRFLAAVNGIDYDKESSSEPGPKGDVSSREQVELRAKMRMEGKSTEEIEVAELANLGLVSEPW